MIILRNLAFILFLSVPTYLATASTAHAYLDPGTGSMILQIAMGGLAGLLVIGKLYWAKFSSIFSRQRGDAGKLEEPTAEEP
jgi:hypothetical protein